MSSASTELHWWLGIGVAALGTVAAVFRVASGGVKAGALRGYRLALLGTPGVVGATSASWIPMIGVRQ